MEKLANGDKAIGPRVKVKQGRSYWPMILLLGLAVAVMSYWAWIQKTPRVEAISHQIGSHGSVSLDSSYTIVANSAIEYTAVSEFQKNIDISVSPSRDVGDEVYVEPSEIEGWQLEASCMTCVNRDEVSLILAAQPAIDEELIVAVLPQLEATILDYSKAADALTVRPASAESLPLYQSSDLCSYIGAKAIDRGYLPRLDGIDQVEVVEGTTINPLAGSAWVALRDAGLEEGHQLWLTSGYRDVANQALIIESFMQSKCIEAIGSNCINESILAGEMDEVVDATLAQVAMPGYSKHHTGYAIDIVETTVGQLEDFVNTESYAWLAAEDFAVAKSFGFIPSYPEGIPSQGPNPEPWEFIYIGTDNIEVLVN